MTGGTGAARRGRSASGRGRASGGGGPAPATGTGTAIGETGTDTALHVATMDSEIPLNHEHANMHEVENTKVALFSDYCITDFNDTWLIWC